PALRAYRDAFEPSEDFPAPHALLAVSAVLAETEEEADRLAASMDLAWVRLQRGEFAPIPSPEEALAYAYSPQERAIAARYRALQVVGAPGAVRARIGAMAAEAGADEVMVTSNIHGHEARLRSYELLAEAFAQVASA